MNSSKSFILTIGTQKSGTTSIHKLLSKHGKISLPKIKETHFFSNEINFNKGKKWYFNQFNRDRDIMCEVDPSYLFFSNCILRIKATIENPKFIIIRLKNNNFTSRNIF